MALLYKLLFNKKNIFSLFVFLLTTTAIYFALRINAIGLLSNQLINAPIEKLNLINRMMNMPMIFLFYIRTFFLPINLSVSYHWIVAQINFNYFFFPLILDFIFLLFLAVITIFIRRESSPNNFRLYVFFVTWFFLGIMLHLQFLPLDQTVAERWFYFPIVGLLGVLGIFTESVNLKHTNKLFFLIILIIFFLTARTFIRSFDWKDNFIISTHDLKVSKEAYNLENAIGAYYADNGLYKEAIAHALKSISIFPYASNYTNLGADYSHVGDYKNAKDAYFKAFQYSDNYTAYYNYAVLCLFYGNPKKNIDFIKNDILKKYPINPSIWYILSMLEYTKGSKADALRDIQQAMTYANNSTISSMYYRISNNQPLILKVNNGFITF